MANGGSRSPAVTMSRAASFRRHCPDIVKRRIEIASSSQFYVVQELGPMAFIVKEPEVPNDDENGPAKIVTGRKFKVGLGSLQTCTCPTFLKDGELCVHTLWVMLKVFGVSRESDVVYQRSLVEREIGEIMRCRQHRRPSLPAVEEPEESSSAAIKTTEIPPRPIQQGDVCPICLEELSASSRSLTYCKKSCGNYMHAKCARVLMDHQNKSMGMDTVKCPLCRKDLGTVEELKAQLQVAEKHQRQKHFGTAEKKLAVHKGIVCQECGCTAIVGKCHRCSVCQNYHLCDRCFTSGAHSDHAFTHRSRPASATRPSPRRVPPTFPPAVIADMELRELGDQDYDTLLVLDTPGVNQGDLPLHIVNGFPTERAVGDKWVGQTCKVCMERMKTGDVIRKIPCSHGFHRNCIDRWLLQHRTTCPSCGLAAYSSLGPPDDGDERPDEASVNLDKADYRAMTYATAVQRRRKGKRIKQRPGRGARSTNSGCRHSPGAFMVIGSCNLARSGCNGTEATQVFCLPNGLDGTVTTARKNTGLTGKLQRRPEPLPDQNSIRTNSVLDPGHPHQILFSGSPRTTDCPATGTIPPSTASPMLPSTRNAPEHLVGRSPNRTGKRSSEPLVLPPIHVTCYRSGCAPPATFKQSASQLVYMQKPRPTVALAEKPRAWRLSDRQVAAFDDLLSTTRVSASSQVSSRRTPVRW